VSGPGEVLEPSERDAVAGAHRGVERPRPDPGDQPGTSVLAHRHPGAVTIRGERELHIGAAEGSEARRDAEPVRELVVDDDRAVADRDRPEADVVVERRSLLGPAGVEPPDPAGADD